jgi:S-disulfanyl-L-cysteine oxidoreductase SoxD
MNTTVVCGLFAGAALLFQVHASGSGLTVLDKVYSAEQAQRGAEEYEARCAPCHEGAEPAAPAPKGQPFIDGWREAPLDYLFTHIRTKMPGNAPGSLQESVYLDNLAYLLRENGYPAGNNDLAADKLGSILLVGPGGPQPLPPDAAVRVVGCLINDSSNDWQVTAAPPPVRVRTTDETTPEELALSAAAQPGGAVYRLRDASDFHADTLRGRKVQVKGTLNEVAGKQTVSVQSLEPAGGACAK